MKADRLDDGTQLPARKPYGRVGSHAEFSCFHQPWLCYHLWCLDIGPSDFAALHYVAIFHLRFIRLGSILPLFATTKPSCLLQFQTDLVVPTAPALLVVAAVVISVDAVLPTTVNFSQICDEEIKVLL